MQNMINFVFCFIGYNLADLAVIQSGLADLENLAVIEALLAFLADWITFFLTTDMNFS